MTSRRTLVVLSIASVAVALAIGANSVLREAATTPAVADDTAQPQQPVEGPSWPIVTSERTATLPPGSVAEQPPSGGGPGASPTQYDAGDGLPPPPNQWWTSAAIGPLSEPLWAHPLAVQAREDGLAISGAPALASATAIVTPFEADLVAAVADPELTVTGHGAFSVDLHLRGTAGGLSTTLVQGRPLVTLVPDGAPITLAAAPGAVIEVDGASASVVVGGRTWDVLGDGDLTADDAGTIVAPAAGQLTVALRPDDVDLVAWHDAVGRAAAAPTVTTTSQRTLDADGGTVTQRLHIDQEGDGGPLALLPHHVARSTDELSSVLGTYRHARGLLQVVDATTVTIEVPTGDDPTTGWPALDLSAQTREAVLRDIDADLADEPGAGGSYFGAKEVGRLATIAEIAHAVGADDRRDDALERLRPLLVDWVTYDGPDDSHHLALEPVWGGVLAVPAEFGLEDYNDHHFQYGYLVRGAAVLAEHDRSFAAEHGTVIDLLVDAYTPRVFQPWLGHAAASGFVPFVDGNNQESSSEAIAAWEAAARWGAVTGDDDLVARAWSLLAVEAETTRTYWLGEDPSVRPDGYERITAGIIFDAKVDFATWFSADPEAIVGIQLIPLTAASTYRSDADAALARAVEVEQLVDGLPRSWGDLFAADLAIADPAAARDRIDAGVPREPSTSRAAVRYWIELQAARGSG